MDIDVLLPFHRVDHYLTSAIESLASSKNIKFNVILIDDRKDKSQKIYQLFRQLPKCELVTTPGGLGYGAALKAGTKLISCESVALFNSDDLVHPLRLRKQIEGLDESDLNFTKIQRITEANKKSPSLMGEIRAPIYDPMYLLLGSYGANASWCMRTDWWFRNAFFDSDECLDWRIALNSFSGSKVGLINEPLYYYRKHSNQVTANKKIDNNLMYVVYESWKKTVSEYSMSTFSFETFQVLATPWLFPKIINLQEILNFKREITELLRHHPKEISFDVQNILRRRFIFALRGSANF